MTKQKKPQPAPPTIIADEPQVDALGDQGRVMAPSTVPDDPEVAESVELGVFTIAQAEALMKLEDPTVYAVGFRPFVSKNPRHVTKYSPDGGKTLRQVVRTDIDLATQLITE